jgi:mannose-1-phosphate guanylyltransferase
VSEAIPGFAAIIPAGGVGKRLWPVSRSDRPKFLLDLTGAGRSLIQQTWDRLAPLAGPARVLVVAGENHAAPVAAQLPGLPAANLVAEPSPRDSMPAIALAAASGQRRFGDLVFGSFAADHVITGGDLFEQAVVGAYLAAAEGLIATIGVKPTGPATAYGYIEAGDPVGLVDRPDVRFVKSFKEKPDRVTAERHLASGRHRWNAGMFIFKASVLLGHLATLRPALADGIAQLADAWDTGRRGQIASRVWPRLERIAIDHAIAEPVAALGGLATVPGDFAWSDVGDYDSLAELTPSGWAALADGPAPRLVDSPGALVVNETDQAVSVLGLPGVVVAISHGQVLVTRRDHAQHVKDLS